MAFVFERSGLSTFDFFEACDASLKVYLSAVLDDTFPHPFDDARQLVASYMRVSLIEHRVRSSEIMEDLHHTLHVPSFLGTGE